MVQKLLAPTSSRVKSSYVNVNVFWCRNFRVHAWWKSCVESKLFGLRIFWCDCLVVKGLFLVKSKKTNMQEICEKTCKQHVPNNATKTQQKMQQDTFGRPLTRRLKNCNISEKLEEKQKNPQSKVKETTRNDP